MKEIIRVLHIDTEMGWRGGQQQVMYLFTGMLRLGYATSIVCPPNSALMKVSMNQKLPCVTFPMQGDFDILAGYRIAKLAKKMDYNVLHLHSAHAHSIGIWAKYFHSSLFLVSTRRVDFHIHGFFSKLKYNSTKINKIVCISDAIKKILLSDGVGNFKLQTIHSGVDLNRYVNHVLPPNFKTDLGIPEENIVIGTIAAFVGHKDYGTLIKAAKILLEKHQNITFVAVGDGDELPRMKSIAQENRFGNRFIFTGFRKDVANFLKMFDIFVLPSKWEGLGTSILDAQSVGLPVIACNTGGIPEIITNNINGILVPPQTHVQLYEAIENLILDPSLRAKLGKAGQQTVKKFSVDEMVKKNIELYYSIATSFH